MNKIFLYITIVLCSINVSAQEILVGAKTGINIADIDDNSLSIGSFSMGIVAEYLPESAFFSVNTEFNYLFDPRYMIIPLYLKAFFGDKIRPNIKGGLMPLFRLQPDDLNGPFGFGVMWGGGIDVRVGANYFIFGGLDLFYIPFSYHYRTTQISSSFHLYPIFNIGLKYNLLKKTTGHNTK